MNTDVILRNIDLFRSVKVSDLAIVWKEALFVHLKGVVYEVKAAFLVVTYKVLVLEDLARFNSY